MIATIAMAIDIRAITRFVTINTTTKTATRAVLVTVTAMVMAK
jgi:hypothetical protein